MQISGTTNCFGAVTNCERVAYRCFGGDEQPTSIQQNNQQNNQQTSQKTTSRTASLTTYGSKRYRLLASVLQPTNVQQNNQLSNQQNNQHIYNKNILRRVLTTTITIKGKIEIAVDAVGCTKAWKRILNFSLPAATACDDSAEDRERGCIKNES